MEKIIVYVDDAAYAQQQLGALTRSGASTAWILVACAPRITRRISKWVSHSARENWRESWAEKLFASLAPALKEPGHTLTMVLAKGPLPTLTESLLKQHEGARVVDARRPKFGQEMQPVTSDQKVEQNPWAVPGAVAGLMVALAAE